MKFIMPQWQQSDRIDYVADTNGDHVLDTGWQYFIGPRGWVQWTPTEIVSFKNYVDQMRAQYNASMGTPVQTLNYMYVVRADKMFETARQMLIARGLIR
jgi:hypothetical protein